jgi:hypothetical protein
MNKTTKEYFNIKALLLLIAILVLAYSSFISITGVVMQIKTGNKRYSTEPGLQYTDFKEALSGVRNAGFVTNKNLSSEKNDGEFLMAQSILAPTVLHLNASKYKYNVLDCTSKEHLLFALKSLNAQPVAINKYGKVLAIKQ